MRLSKMQLYFLLLGTFMALCLVYQSFWLFSNTTVGRIVRFDTGWNKVKSPDHVVVSYDVGYLEYTDSFLRNGISDTTQNVSVRYFSFDPELSRLNTPIGNWGFTVTFNVIFFITLSIIFLKPDIITSDNYFILSKRFPFVRKFRQMTSMDDV
ncbi:MAG: hypothetical protein QM802_24460 [Agriterribacter sp.]